MVQTLLVFLGGGIGAAARHGVNIGAARMFGVNFPYGTLVVNIVGSFLMGLLAAWFAFRADAGWTQHTRLFLTTGILGGFTTFSAFSLDTVLLWERGATGQAIGYVVASVGLSVLGLAAGLAIVRSMA
jgi:fluoride exporter